MCFSQEQVVAVVVVSPCNFVLVLVQDCHLLDGLVPEDDGDAVDGAGRHPGRQALGEHPEPLLPPQGGQGLRDGLALDLDPGPGQVQGVGDDAGGAAGRHGRHALDGRVHASGLLLVAHGQDRVQALLEKVVERPPGGAAGHVRGQGSRVPAVEPADPVLAVNGAGDVPENGTKILVFTAGLFFYIFKKNSGTKTVIFTKRTQN